MKLFSKVFCRLSQIDQAAVINSRIRELEEAASQSIYSHDRQRAKRQIRCIERNPLNSEFGISNLRVAEISPNFGNGCYNCVPLGPSPRRRLRAGSSGAAGRGEQGSGQAAVGQRAWARMAEK